VALGSAGIPRLVNILCHKAMLVAFGRGDQRIGAEHVNRAIEDTEDARTDSSHYTGVPGKTGYHRNTLILACLGASALTLVLVWLLVL